MNVFQTPETTMTAEEAEAVVRRHLERVPETPSGPSIADVAEVLRVRPEEVARLLAEIRKEGLKRPARKVTRQERRVWLLSGVIAVILGGTAFGFMRAFRAGPFRMRHQPSYTVSANGSQFQVYLDGSSVGGMDYSDSKEMEAQLLPGLAEDVLRENQWRFPRQPQPEDVIDEARRAVADGQWGNAPGIRIVSMEIRKGDMGNPLRWARATVPVYAGDDSLVADAVDKERKRRVGEAIKTAMKGIPSPPSNPSL